MDVHTSTYCSLHRIIYIHFNKFRLLQPLQHHGQAVNSYFHAPYMNGRDKSRGPCVYIGYPLHRENRENGLKNPCQGKHREYGNFAKT